MARQFPLYGAVLCCRGSACIRGFGVRRAAARDVDARRCSCTLSLLLLISCLPRKLGEGKTTRDRDGGTFQFDAVEARVGNRRQGQEYARSYSASAEVFACHR